MESGGTARLTNSKTIGDVTRSQVLAALLRQGKRVLIPFGDNARYDLAVEEAGVFTRVQCKTGRVSRGAVVFPVASSQYHRGGKRRSYQGQIDAFGVFCPDNGKTYIIPIADLPLVREAKLRLTSPGNAQIKGIRWAARYEVRSPIAQPVERRTVRRQHHRETCE